MASDTAAATTSTSNGGIHYVLDKDLEDLLRSIFGNNREILESLANESMTSWKVFRRMQPQDISGLTKTTGEEKQRETISSSCKRQLLVLNRMIRESIDADEPGAKDISSYTEEKFEDYHDQFLRDMRCQQSVSAVAPSIASPPKDVSIRNIKRLPSNLTMKQDADAVRFDSTTKQEEGTAEFNSTTKQEEGNVLLDSTMKQEEDAARIDSTMKQEEDTARFDSATKQDEGTTQSDRLSENPRNGSSSTSHSDAQWEKKFQLLVEFHKKYKHVAVPTRYPALGGWVANQRTFYKTKKLSQSKIKRLESMGFVFEFNEHCQEWLRMYKWLCSFRKGPNTPLFVPEIDTTKRLRDWIDDQRSQYHKGRLPTNRAHILESIGIRWNALNEGTESSGKRKREISLSSRKLHCPQRDSFKRSSAEDDMEEYIPGDTEAFESSNTNSDEVFPYHTSNVPFDTEFQQIENSSDTNSNKYISYDINSEQKENSSGANLDANISNDANIEKEDGFCGTKSCTVGERKQGMGEFAVPKKQHLLHDEERLVATNAEEHIPDEIDSAFTGGDANSACKEVMNLESCLPNDTHHDYKEGGKDKDCGGVIELLDTDSEDDIPGNIVGFKGGSKDRDCKEVIELLDSDLEENLPDTACGFKGGSENKNIPKEDSSSFASHQKSKDAFWERNFQLLVEHKNKYKTVSISYKAPEFKKLHSWVGWQQRSYRNNRLSDYKIQRLQSLGVTLNACGDKWEKKFRLLVEYQKIHKTTRVPQCHPMLGSWVSYQRKSYVEKRLAQNRIKRLESIGFEFIINKAEEVHGLFNTISEENIPIDTNIKNKQNSSVTYLEENSQNNDSSSFKRSTTMAFQPLCKSLSDNIVRSIALGHSCGFEELNLQWLRKWIPKDIFFSPDFWWTIRELTNREKLLMYVGSTCWLTQAGKDYVRKYQEEWLPDDVKEKVKHTHLIQLLDRPKTNAEMCERLRLYILRGEIENNIFDYLLQDDEYHSKEEIIKDLKLTDCNEGTFQSYISSLGMLLEHQSNSSRIRLNEEVFPEGRPISSISSETHNSQKKPPPSSNP